MTADVLDRVGHGEVAALAELYDLTCPLVWRMLELHRCDSKVAEDLHVTFYLQVWHGIDRWNNAETASPIGWLLGELHRHLHPPINNGG